MFCETIFIGVEWRSGVEWSGVEWSGVEWELFIDYLIIMIN